MRAARLFALALGGLCGCEVLFNGNDLRGLAAGKDLGGATGDLGNSDGGGGGGADLGASCPATTLSFQSTPYESGSQVPDVLAAGDFNNDGKLDLVSGNEVGANLTVYLGDGK